MVVVAAGGNERGLRAVPLGELETEDVAVERERPREVGDLEMHVADARSRVDAVHGARVGLAVRKTNAGAGREISMLDSRFSIGVRRGGKWERWDFWDVMGFTD